MAFVNPERFSGLSNCPVLTVRPALFDNLEKTSIRTAGEITPGIRDIAKVLATDQIDSGVIRALKTPGRETIQI